MRRRSKISIDPKYFLIAFSIICVILIIVSFKFSEKMVPIKTAIGTVITPMQKGINTVGNWIADKVDDFESMKKLQQENEMLTEKVNTLSQDNKILQQDKYELESLRKLFSLNKKYNDYPMVAARIISSETSNWYNTFLIDKGSDDGLTVNMNVIAGNGLVGIITEVGKNYSKIRSIIDDNSYVTGMFLKTQDTCYVKGNLKLLDQGNIEVELINKNAKVEDGYEVVTSPNSNKFLEGILIGYVNNISVNSTNMTKSGYLTPAVDFSNLDMVLVITELKEELDPPLS